MMDGFKFALRQAVRVTDAAERGVIIGVQQLTPERAKRSGEEEISYLIESPTDLGVFMRWVGQSQLRPAPASQSAAMPE